ncbi:MAG: hypothetical protein U0271_18455 [Polyangiaceae bacterium]
MADKRPCGKHTELASNDAAKITRCPCGTVHVTLHSNGVTFRLSDQQMKSMTRALMLSLDKLEEAEERDRARYGGGTCDA